MRNQPTLHLMHVPGDPARDGLVQAYRDTYPGTTCVHADPDRNGILWNHGTIVRCMLEHSGDQHPSEFQLVVQDDAQPLTGWLDHLTAVMRFAPTDFVSLFHLGQYGAKLAAKGVPFGVGVNAMWGPAVLYRNRVLPSYLSLVEVVEELNEPTGAYRKWDDGLMAVYNVIRGTRSALTSRALVQHADWVSLAGNQPGRWRKANCTIESHRGPSWAARPATASAGTSMDEAQRKLLSEVVRKGWR